ncbi:putative exported protein [Halobacteriovorax marinus SJ]|uniref:Exported protein n=1 Tax=Halobacteriovorax marinus (strain ATCC BAA-682 / DSM 15412 / SJ) TaxID=862908 RepID=E1X000_HALMS|nr:hypothetical protein [Halobacteriovorax marinus]CBW27936.1 putative exported protein [Halobacteriovorax marinus SJ]
MKTLIAFLLMSSSFAGLTGKWSAGGFFDYNNRSGECKEIFMQIKQTDKKLYILDGGYICSDIQASYPPSSFNIVDGALYYFGEKVGEVTENEINLNYENGVYGLSLKKIGTELIYKESWDDGEDYLLIEGKLNLLL